MIVFKKAFHKYVEIFSISSTHRRLQWKSYVLVIIIRNNDVIISFKRIFHPVFPFNVKPPSSTRAKEMWENWMREKFITMRWMVNALLCGKYFISVVIFVQRQQARVVRRISARIKFKGFDLALYRTKIFLFLVTKLNFQSPTFIHEIFRRIFT